MPGIWPIPSVLEWDFFTSVVIFIGLLIRSGLHSLLGKASMSPEMRSQLKTLIVKHEGYKNFPYFDSVGKLTIGVGYNISDRGLPDTWIDSQLQEDIDYFYRELDFNFPWFSKLNHARQIALIDMCFMGFKKFLSFKKMLSAFEKQDYNTAAKEILNSRYASQVGNRAKDLAYIIEKGILLS